MSYFLLGLQYAAGAFMIILIAIVGMLLVMWGVRLIYGQRSQTADLGASEGDPRNFRLRTIDDDKYWDDV
ncbi:hypothetical protein G6L07_08290 [Agrobacterium rhizogenes]|nr:hypothetical protein [Rhizobium rhizogenes]